MLALFTNVAQPWAHRSRFGPAVRFWELMRSITAEVGGRSSPSIGWRRFDLVHFDTPGAQIGRYAIERFLAIVTR